MLPRCFGHQDFEDVAVALCVCDSALMNVLWPRVRASQLWTCRRERGSAMNVDIHVTGL